MIWKGSGSPYFTFGGALTIALIAAFGAVGLGLIHRAISKRNNSLGVFYILTWCGTIPLRDMTLPLGEAVFRQSRSLIATALLITLTEIIQRAWKSRRSKPQLSPLADAEIDARPLP
jgi:hypothetical protein